MEIERKFLFHKLPDQLDTYPHYGIEQAYVTTNPVIRVRKKTLYDAASAVSDCQYVLTVKSSGMLARQEFELPIDEAAYRTLCAKADGNVIAKTRYKIPLNQGLTLELDLFEGLFGVLHTTGYNDISLTSHDHCCSIVYTFKTGSTNNVDCDCRNFDR